MKLRWAEDFYWRTYRTPKMKRRYEAAGMCFGPGLTLPFGFALVRFKPPFKDEEKDAAIAAEKAGRKKP